VVSTPLTLGEVGRVLEQLLRERVSIRDLGAILEALLETAPANKSLVVLVEAAREALGRRLVRPLLDGDGQLPVLLLGPGLEEEILATLGPETGQRLLAAASPPHRFCEIAYRFRICRGAARAPLPKSGSLSREALAGACAAARGGGCGQRDSAGDPVAPRGHCAMTVIWYWSIAVGLRRACGSGKGESHGT
jgi:hypothetical protein